MHEACCFTKEGEGKVRCRLCPHECVIPEGKVGACHVRVNRNGQLISLVYGQLAAIHSDPVEKKPLYHFYPGRQILSVGTHGCNLRCSFCQNYNLSQCDVDAPSRDFPITPSQLAHQAMSIPGNIGIAYTYNEPTVFYEFMVDVAELIHSAGLKNVAITNGFINSGPLLNLLPLMDAFNVDLKSFSDSFYRQMTGGRLAPVMDTLKAIVNAGKHLEITYLVIPTLNDSEEEFREMIDWISLELGPDIPLHLSRYFPAWKLSLPPTPESTLDNFADIAAEKLRYIYTGNVSTDIHSCTYCHECKTLLIKRLYYHTELSGVTGDGRCSHCGATLAGYF